MTDGKREIRGQTCREAMQWRSWERERIKKDKEEIRNKISLTALDSPNNNKMLSEKSNCIY